MSCQQIYRFGAVSALLCLLFVTGCKDKPQIPKAPSAKVEKTPKAPKLPETIEGTWLFTIVEHQPGQKQKQWLMRRR